MPTAFITGVTGQDGSYLTELLLSKGYKVHGVVRRSSTIERKRLEHLTTDPNVYGERFFLHYADLSDTTSVRRILNKVRPDEFYHLAGQSHVGLSFEIPESTCEFTAMGTLRLLEILRDLDQPPRFLNIGSSELFGRPEQVPQDETTPFRPVTPYGVSKAFAVDTTRVYRESFGMFACNAIPYNHESPRRGEAFVTRKIARSVAEILKDPARKLRLGNLDVERDWGYAPEYVEAMWRILQAETADDFVLATGRLTSLQEFLDHAFGHAGLDWRAHVEIDPRFQRPAEPAKLVGNPAKARRLLDWHPTTLAPELARIMVDAEIADRQAAKTESQ